jgi:hypothetical protein
MLDEGRRHVSRLLVGVDNHNEDLGAGREVREAPRHLSAALARSPTPVLIDIEREDLVLLDQMPGHSKAHVPDTHDSNFHCADPLVAADLSEYAA